MKAHFQYLAYLLRHKWFVFRECCRLGVVWLGIVHDWSKLLPSEWFPYAWRFYGSPHDVVTTQGLFNEAWLHHQNRNKHHWQYWVLKCDEEGVEVMEMPLRYVKEMVADWRGAGLAQGNPDTLGWYRKNREKMLLYSGTRVIVERMLERYE